jgi:hypothetical protein
MTAKEAKKLRCACQLRHNKAYCGRPAIVTIRMETESGPEYLTFCCGHLKRAQQTLHALRKMLKIQGAEE